MKKTKELDQDMDNPPVITIDSHELEDVHQFSYLGSSISDDLFLNTEINQRTGKTATTLGRLPTRVWKNPNI